jgi:TatD family-associated radical SAM protein
VRNAYDAVNGKDVLWPDYEPDAEMILDDISKRDIAKYDEIVFCGYGEPMLRYDTVFDVCRQLKQENAGIKIRINTNGHGNLIAGYDITPEMEGLVDAFSVSMNAKDSAQYEEICRPAYGEKTFGEVLLFAKKAKAYVPGVTLTAVGFLRREDILECEKIAHGLGLSFRLRTMIK